MKPGIMFIIQHILNSWKSTVDCSVPVLLLSCPADMLWAYISATRSFHLCKQRSGVKLIPDLLLTGVKKSFWIQEYPDSVLDRWLPRISPRPSSLPAPMSEPKLGRSHRRLTKLFIRLQNYPKCLRSQLHHLGSQQETWHKTAFHVGSGVIL